MGGELISDLCFIYWQSGKTLDSRTDCNPFIGIDVLLAAGKDPHFLGDSMKMKELTPLVGRIMNNMADTRGNDDLLYSCVLRCLGADLDVSACEFFRTYRKAGFPTMETVGRLRRMIQAEYPELKADESTTNRRKRQEEEIHEFFKKE